MSSLPPPLRKRILVVDDDELMRKLADRVLSRLGYQVEFAEDGESALRQIAAAPPDLVLLDLVLPGLDGWAVLERLNERPGCPPVLVVSGNGDPTTRERAVRQRAGYLPKPFALADLARACQRLLDQGSPTG